jgi:hydroxymethylglutaryl-CoA lyase
MASTEIRKIKIVEVGPRDGLQNEQTILDIQTKIKFIELLKLSGLDNIEIGSFVSPEWVPQMANTQEVLQGLNKSPESNYSVLIPNMTGMDQVLSIKNKPDSIAVFTAASETFCQKNTNCSIAESMSRFKQVINTSLDNNISVRGYISCVMGCPYEGKVNIKKVVELAVQLHNLGCYEISLGDTIGVGNVRQVKELINSVSAVIPINKLAVHFHDTYGQALVNVYAALELGVTVIDSAVAGLGGCPYAKNNNNNNNKASSGNLATEDLLYMLNGLGLQTNIDLQKLIAAGSYICQCLNIEPRSKVALQLLMAK